MPCGGIRPQLGLEKQLCYYCTKPGCDHFVYEWDAAIHAGCVVPFLHTEEGEIVLDHRHAIQVFRCLLQDEGGELMDPNQTLKELRVALQVLDMEPNEENATLVVDKFQDLDGWLKLGGYPPTDWKRDD